MIPNCDWCDQVATVASKRRVSYGGTRFEYACRVHDAEHCRDGRSYDHRVIDADGIGRKLAKVGGAK